jgi:4'-phosphopantetheinyl transferase EntD
MSDDFPVQWVESDTVLLIERIDASTGELAAEEQPFARTMRPRRLREFTAGRRLARRALALMGEASVAIPVGAAGEPLWPSGVVGSIAHTGTHAAVVLSRRARHASVGIDLDDHRLLGEAAAKDLMTEEEIELVLKAGWTCDRAQAQNLVFCAKEALFKCQYPMTRLAQLDFEHVRLTPSNAPGLLKASPVLGHSETYRACLEAVRLSLHVVQQLTTVLALASGARESRYV